MLWQWSSILAGTLVAAYLLSPALPWLRARYPRGIKVSALAFNSVPPEVRRRITASAKQLQLLGFSISPAVDLPFKSQAIGMLALHRREKLCALITLTYSGRANGRASVDECVSSLFSISETSDLIVSGNGVCDWLGEPDLLLSKKADMADVLHAHQMLLRQRDEFVPLELPARGQETAFLKVVLQSAADLAEKRGQCYVADKHYRLSAHGAWRRLWPRPLLRRRRAKRRARQMLSDYRMSQTATPIIAVSPNSTLTPTTSTHQLAGSRSTGSAEASREYSTTSLNAPEVPAPDDSGWFEGKRD